MLSDIKKGDTINLECSINQSIEDWKIRCEIYDDSGNSIKLANVNSGGSSEQIEEDDIANGIFIIHVTKNLTTNFDDLSYIEIEIENENGELFTVYQDEIQFDREKITWTAP